MKEPSAGATGAPGPAVVEAPAFSPRLLAALAAAKLTGAASRRLGRGGGTALPGLISQHLVPDFVHRLGRQFGLGTVLLTGTNGKTTTAAMVAAIARLDGRRVVHNRSGSNLMRGLAAMLAEEVRLDGRLAAADSTMAVLEVDEATVPLAVPALRPLVVSVLNLFRDQLDRYGEVNTVFARWQQAVHSLPAGSILVLNGDDPTVAALGETGERRCLTFGIDDPSCAIEGQEHASDARWCHVCGTEYRYAALYAGHVGIWGCEGCGRQRRTPDVVAEAVRLQGFDGASIALRTPQGPLELALPLGGLYNVYNALAAVTTALALGLPRTTIARALLAFRPAFGRQEQFTVRGRHVRILLGKNPAGLNQVLRLLAAQPGRKNLLIVLNDRIADGTDVSWVWDVDYERLADQVGEVVTAGTRAAEMALRLKYAGWRRPAAVIPAIGRALDQALRRSQPGGELFVIPTYTAMLEVRELLARLAGRAHFWEQA